MKIRRILATAVAAAVTTPVVFLSATPAFADTKPSSASTQKPTSNEDPKDETPSLEELKAAVALAQKAFDEAEADVAKALAGLEARDKPDHPLRVAVTEAKTAADAAAAAKTAADAALATAVQAEKDLLPEATEEEKTAAAAAVTAAKATADEAATAKTAADEKLSKASKALADDSVAAFQVLALAQKVQKAAAKDLAEAKEELKFFEEIGGDCKEDPSLKLALSGPKTLTAGQSAVFSLRFTNTSDRTLDTVAAFVDAMQSGDDEEVIDEESDVADRLIPIEWSSPDVLEWTPITEEFDSIEVGKLAKGASYDVKVRLTVAADAPAGEGAAFAYAGYENNDGSCGLGGFSEAYFDIAAAKGDKPKPTPEPTPSETTATPTPAPTASTGGNSNTTQQGGSSRTPVNGSLAETGANDNVTQIGLAAGAAVVLGAGALFVARRRKAGASA
ncbi:peptidase [Streptomyces sp. NPDC002773]|uniref:peptidase n=1 Tax=Streptomyces sp. NPDC002773 TaxID=3154430 RepID=UPI00331C60A4